MAELCKACAIEIWGEDAGDLADITTEDEWNKNLATLVVCEGCGPIQVDPSGNCVSNDCLKAGFPGHGTHRPVVPPTGSY